MEEQWCPIEGFEQYLISNYGRVMNAETNRVLVLSNNRLGIITVTLSLDAKHYTRSVSRLVADHWLPRPELETFNTPIQLDGDRTNTRVDNMAWRPRWFAREYRMQLRKKHYLLGPIECIETGEVFDNTWDAAKAYGLLEKEIASTLHRSTPVWPTRQRFRFTQ
jgi:hypothetical protein